MRRYNPKEIEPKWQAVWDKNQVYKADLGSPKPKYIGMSMFNYPSGAGIHIGHAMNYTISDVMARFKRQQGFESYHPIGWDAFGLPAENYAIKAGVSPQVSMAKIIPSYRKQYKAMGWSNDWSKEISTHLPEYYKWTQWIFSEMYRKELAYQDSRMQWWCDQCQTVLANEQVMADGKCWRHDGANDPIVGKKEVKQWFFKITDYADELLEATDDLNWTESVKLAQKNWIGKSVGAEIDFKVNDSQESIKVFTTRPDTIFGATFMVLAPEHELVDKLTTSDKKEEVEKYQKEIARKTEIERQMGKDKSGVFTGGYAVNPANNAKIPIWIAEYVLSGYGTGAIMAVPAHDERDYEFAQKFDLPSTRVIDGPVQEVSASSSFDDISDDVVLSKVKDGEKVFYGEGRIINSDKYNDLASSEAREKIVADLASQGLAQEKVNFKMRDWSVSRQRYWGAPIPIIHCKEHGAVLVPDTQLPVILPELTDFEPSGDGRSALARATDWVHVKCPKCGGDAQRETDTLDTYICSSWYMLRYLDPKNDQDIFDSAVVNKWMPIDFYNGGDHATAHMIYARFVTRFFHKLGLVDNPEPFNKFLFNGKVTASDGTNFSKSKGNGVDPLEIINSGYGADALRTYLMFAAPLDLWVRWDPQGVPGTYRFLTRVWNITHDYLQADKPGGDNPVVMGVIHKTIKKVTHDVEHQKYNTAIAAMMQCTNSLYDQQAKDGFKGGDSWQFALESLVQLVAPFAPHIADELWQGLGHEDSVQADHWPQWNEEFIKEDNITIAVQINGKVRAEITIPADITEEEAVQTAIGNERIAQLIGAKKILKTIYVAGRLISFVVAD